MKKTVELANWKKNASGKVVEAGQDFRKNDMLNYVIPEQYAKRHRTCATHIHDLEYYDITYNCIGISVRDLVGSRNRSFQNMIRELYRKIVELTNMQSGGIGLINFDSDIAPYIGSESDTEIMEAFRELFLDLNMNIRKGCEKPYVTINFGLETSANGRRAVFLMLDAFEKGDERGNPFIFPNLVFKIKSGINFESTTVNYDLYRKALGVTAKRMVPTYFNCDSISNRQYPAEIIGIMGCRTRVVTNRNGKEGSLNRGNVACVTLNLPQTAYQAHGNIEQFYTLLDQNLEDARGVLVHRFRTLCKNGLFEEHYEKKYYAGAEKRDAFEMLKNGTLSIGFIGLWDAVGILMRQDVDSSVIIEKYYEEAYEIVRHMRNYTDKISQEEHLNFSLLASAAEGVTGNFAQYDEQHLGRDFNACKKGFYTNSFHVPVNMNVDYKTKIEFEGKFHRLCSGGSITYVELEEMPGKNVEAVQEIISCAYENDCNYMGINFPMDYCLECGYIGRVADVCPCCESCKIKRLRRVSGYLSEESSFTAGKRRELYERNFHMAAEFMGEDKHER